MAGAIIGGASVFNALIGADSASNAADVASNAAANSTAETRRQFDLVRGDTASYRGVGEGALFKLSDMFGIPHSVPGSLSPQEHAEMQQLLDKQKTSPEMMASPILRGVMQPTGNTAALNPAESARLQELQGKLNTPTTATSQFNPDDMMKSMPGYQFRLGEAQKALERAQSKYRGDPRAMKELVRYNQDFASNEFGKGLEPLFRLSGIGGNAVNTSAGAGMTTAGQIGSANQFAGGVGANAALTGGAAINNSIQGGLSNYYTMKTYNDLMNKIPNPSTPSTFPSVGASPY
jgi:hypothetical protein